VQNAAMKHFFSDYVGFEAWAKDRDECRAS